MEQSYLLVEIRNKHPSLQVSEILILEFQDHFFFIFSSLSSKTQNIIIFPRETQIPFLGPSYINIYMHMKKEYLIDYLYKTFSEYHIE